MNGVAIWIMTEAGRSEMQRLHAKTLKAEGRRHQQLDDVSLHYCIFFLFTYFFSVSPIWLTIFCLSS